MNTETPMQIMKEAAQKTIFEADELGLVTHSLFCKHHDITEDQLKVLKLIAEGEFDLIKRLATRLGRSEIDVSMDMFILAEKGFYS